MLNEILIEGLKPTNPPTNVYYWLLQNVFKEEAMQFCYLAQSCYQNYQN